MDSNKKHRIKCSLQRTIIIYCCLFSALVSGQHMEQNEKLYKANLTSEEWQEDYQYLKDAIEKIHPNPYFVIDSSAFYKNYQKLYEQIPANSDQKNFINLFKLVSLIEDGHTNIRFLGNNFTVSLPKIEAFVFEDGFYIKQAFDHDLAGKEIIEINGHRIEDVFKKAAAIISADNDFHVKNVLA